MTSRKTSEGQILQQKFSIGTVNNDAELIRSKGIKSPSTSSMYAIATMDSGKTQRWFRSPEALERFQENTDSQYSLRIIGPHKQKCCNNN